VTPAEENPVPPACAECGYALEGLIPCPECGWSPGDPVSSRRIAAGLTFYFACTIPIIEAVVLVGWGIQHLLVPPASRNISLVAIGASVLGVITSTVISNLAKYRDGVFSRLRWVCLVLACIIGMGLAALSLLRPGNHAILLLGLTLLNLGIGYMLLVSGNASVSVLSPAENETERR